MCSTSISTTADHIILMFAINTNIKFSQCRIAFSKIDYIFSAALTRVNRSKLNNQSTNRHYNRSNALRHCGGSCNNITCRAINSSGTKRYILNSINTIFSFSRRSSGQLKMYIQPHRGTATHVTRDQRTSGQCKIITVYNLRTGS